MKRFFFSILLMLLFSLLFAQNPGDTIRMVKQNGSRKFYQGTKEFTFLKLSEPFKSDQVASRYYKQAKVSRTFHGIIFGTGFITACYGIMFGVGQGLENNDPSQVWAGLISGAIVGGGIMALSIPFGKAYKRDLALAIKHYNSGLSQPVANRPIIRAGISGNGISLRMIF
jgi:hypothetical protein